MQIRAIILVALCSAGLFAAGSSQKTSRREIYTTATLQTDANGIAKAHFKDTHPCPSTRITAASCPGWVVDYVKPLSCGGADEPRNMQWRRQEDLKRPAACDTAEGGF